MNEFTLPNGKVLKVSLKLDTAASSSSLTSNEPSTTTISTNLEPAREESDERTAHSSQVVSEDPSTSNTQPTEIAASVAQDPKEAETITEVETKTEAEVQLD